MNKRHLIAVAILALLAPSLAIGQDVLGEEDDSVSKGRVWGNYTVRQSIEFGGRITENSGNQQMYDTLVNLQSGPRLLGQELSMQSLSHNGSLFDNLYLSMFGLGGDPNDVVRLRVEKNKWYNFVGLYRRDVNFFDYNLFANPLTLNLGPASPTNSQLYTPGNPWFINSPHMQDTTRNMGDFDLTLFPQSAIRIRLGFSRNNNAGLLDSTLHSSNEIDLTENSFSRSDRYTFGVDVRAFKRTTISFTQFYEHDKVDTSFVSNNLFPFTIGAGGPSANLGVPVTGCTLISAGVASPTCNNGIFSYTLLGNQRTNLPTSQLSLQSNYFRKLDITASGTYSNGSSKLLNFSDVWRGLGDHSNAAAYQDTGTPQAERVSGNADVGLTYHLSKNWEISDKFRWLNWRSPGYFNQTTFNCFPTLPSTAHPNLLTPVAGGANNSECAIAALVNGLAVGGVPGVSPLPVPVSLSNGADAFTPYSSLTPFIQFLGEQTYFNTFTVKWSPNRRASAYIGFRYGRRDLRASEATGVGSVTNFTGTVNGAAATLLPAVTTPFSTEAEDSFVTQINEYTALGGVVIRPIDGLRINADTELMYADNSFTYISPRHQQRVRASATYKVNRWASVTGSVHIIESRNDFATNINQSGLNLFTVSGAGATATPPVPYVTTTNQPAYGNKNHLRYYSIGASLNPNRFFGLDFGWTYMDQLINSATCMPIAAGVVTPAFAASNMCPGIAGGTDSTTITAGTAASPNLPVIQAYQENTNTAYVILALRPIHRVTLNLGYDITSTTGYDNWLRADTGAPLQVLGDAFGNVPAIAGNPGAGTVYLGPFPNQPAGPQDFNWHKLTAGIAVGIAKGVTFKGSYSYYDYNEKEGNVSINQLVALPRNFHTNVGTLSLKYAF